VIFSIMQDQRGAADQGASCWAHTVGLARRLWLTDDGTDVMMAPVEALKELETEVLLNEHDLTLAQANEKLAAVKGDMLHIVVTADVSAAEKFGIDLKQGGKWDCTSFTYEVAAETIHGSTENRGEGCKVKNVSGALTCEDGRITMDIYVDRSLVEAFFNESRSISIRSYVEDPASQGISLNGTGDIVIEELYVAAMGSIFK
jgi:sucrose-6-phosphate hydrolase SacC (GH32 family)